MPWELSERVNAVWEAHDRDAVRRVYEKMPPNDLQKAAYALLLDAESAVSRATATFAMERLYLIIVVLSERSEKDHNKIRRLERAAENMTLQDRKKVIPIEVNKP